VLSAPAGSGKTVLLRSWMGEASLAGCVAWVSAGRDERDPQRLWLSVLGALRQTTPGAGLVRELSAAPNLDGWAIVERLLSVEVISRILSADQPVPPRTGRALGVGLVAVGTLAADWGTTLGREPSRGIRNQVLPSMRDAPRVQANAVVLEHRGVQVQGFWRYLRGDWRLWALTVAQGTFLLGYHTFVSYGPLFTIEAFHKSPQEGSALTSWVYLSVIVFLVLGGIASDRLRLRKPLGLVFTILSGAGLLLLGSLSDHALSSTTIVVLYVAVGAVMACAWPPLLALFSEAAEDVHASRQTTAFAGMNMVTGTLYHSWVLVIPLVLVPAGWRWVWFIAGFGALATAPILVICRGSWRRFTLPEVQLLEGADMALGQLAERDLGREASA
jgi:hypothetical protein